MMPALGLPKTEVRSEQAHNKLRLDVVRPVGADIIRAHAHWQERRGNHLLMKYLAIIALAAVAIGLGACAKKEPAPAPAPSSTGMSK